MEQFFVDKKSLTEKSTLKISTFFHVEFLLLINY